MKTNAAQISVLVSEKCACIRIVGRASVTSGAEFKLLLEELRRRGNSRFVLDLTECTNMDSTIQGLLAGFALKLKTAGGCFELYRPNERIVESLDTLGALHLFNQTDTTLTDGAIHISEPPPVTRADTTRTCLEAHETLMALSPANIARFKDVTTFLAEDLRKQQG